MCQYWNFTLKYIQIDKSVDTIVLYLITRLISLRCLKFHLRTEFFFKDGIVLLADDRKIKCSRHCDFQAEEIID